MWKTAVVLKSAMTGFLRMWEMEVSKEGRINRPEKSSRSKRRWGKLCGKQQWFKSTKQAKNANAKNQGKKKGNIMKQEIEGVYYVPYTKGSRLKKKIQAIEDNAVKNKKTGRLRILERLGSSIKEDISNPTPWKNSHCGRSKCMACKTREGACKARSVVYQIDCMDCLSQGVKSQ